MKTKSDAIREIIEEKVVKNLSKRIPADTDLDTDKKNIIVSKVLNSYLKYQNKKIVKYYKEKVEIYDNIDYNEKVVLFD